jgi:hypothetical protein
VSQFLKEIWDFLWIVGEITIQGDDDLAFRALQSCTYGIANPSICCPVQNNKLGKFSLQFLKDFGGIISAIIVDDDDFEGFFE